VNDYKCRKSVGNFNEPFIICRYVYDLSTHPISHAYLELFIKLVK